jgi:predicted transcriptional regulator of viral defense system
MRLSTSFRALRLLEDITRTQSGLVTVQQAVGAGVSGAQLQRMSGGTHPAFRRVARGVYHTTTTPLPSNLAVRIAWLQLAPAIPAYDRTPELGIVSHRSAAALYRLGNVSPVDHDFTFPRPVAMRRQGIPRACRAGRQLRTAL